MVSSSKLDSGKISGWRSNFSQTCTLLSQYLKENGSFGDLSLSLTPNFVPETKGTMDLFPKIEQLEDCGVNKANEQLTIFYGGQVIVFDNFPADKANEIMTLASKNTAAAPPSAAFAPPQAEELAVATPESVPTLSPLPAPGSDLPIARKNSLARFLEKRKDRITGNAPYQAINPAPKPVKPEPFLELGSDQLPLHVPRN